GRALPKPLDGERLASWLEELHERWIGPPVRVILLDNDATAQAYYGEGLRTAGIEVQTLRDPMRVLERLDASSPTCCCWKSRRPAAAGRNWHGCCASTPATRACPSCTSPPWTICRNG
ncbi:hypothetical protein, partial [Methylogaea oryzae]|uniref:hypothetical protein n=1 Tax=Methylogaea oryzae TaxID=1295382 RepID=UPI0020D14FB8